MRPCTFCNMALPDQARFCSNCGTPAYLPSTSSPTENDTPPAFKDASLQTAVSDAAKTLDSVTQGRSGQDKLPLKEHETEEDKAISVRPIFSDDASTLPSTCPFCNMDLADQARFCGSCGHLVALPSTPPPAPFEKELPTMGSGPLLPMAIGEASKILDGAAWGRQQPQKETAFEENALPTEPVSNPAHGEHHQPLPPYGDHRQPLPTHREHHQVQPIHAPHQQALPMYGAHQQALPMHGAHQQTQPMHGSHQQTQSIHGAHQQAQPIHGAHQQAQLMHGAHQQAQPIYGAHQQAQPFHGERPSGRNILSSRLSLRQTKIFFLVAIILLVLGGGTGLYTLDEASEQNGVTVGFLQFDESLENQIHEGLTHNQAHAIATESATVATTTATAQQHPFPQNGTLALDDPLTHNTDRYQWSKGYWSNTGTSCSFTDGGYHIVETNTNRFYYCISSSTNFSNFAFQVQMTFVSGKFGGILFRSQAKQHYYFSIGLNQTYNLQMFVDDTGETSRNLARGSSAAINSTPSQTNLIAVAAHGNNIDLYVNNQYITSVQDSSYSSGQIGLVAQDEKEPAEVIFSNAKVWTL